MLKKKKKRYPKFPRCFGAEIVQGASWYRSHIGEVVSLREPKPESNLPSGYFFPADKRLGPVKKAHVKRLMQVRILIGASWYSSMVGKAIAVYADPIGGRYRVHGKQRYVSVDHVAPILHEPRK